MRNACILISVEVMKKVDKLDILQLLVRMAIIIVGMLDLELLLFRTRSVEVYKVHTNVFGKYAYTSEYKGNPVNKRRIIFDSGNNSFVTVDVDNVTFNKLNKDDDILVNIVTSYDGLGRSKVSYEIDTVDDL